MGRKLCRSLARKAGAWIQSRWRGEAGLNPPEDVGQRLLWGCPLSMGGESPSTWAGFWMSPAWGGTPFLDHFRDTLSGPGAQAL